MGDMGVQNTREIRPVGISTSRTQRNPTSYCQSYGHLTPKALGFSQFLVNVACMEKTLFLYDFYGFDGIRST